MKTADVRDRNNELWSPRSSRRPMAAGRATDWAGLAAVLVGRQVVTRLRIAWQGSGTTGVITTGLLAGLAYYAGARLGFLLVFPGSPLSVIWPPNAIVLAVLLLMPSQAWWAVLLGVLPAHLIVEWQSGVAPWAVPGLYVTNCGEALLGATIVRRLSGGGPPWLGTLRQVAVYVIGAAIAAPFVMSFLDTGVVVLTNWASREHYWLLWEERFISAVLTNLTVAPVILIGACRGWGRWQSISRWRGAEVALLALSILVSSYLAFSTPTALAPAAPELLYLLLPVLLWAAVRFGVGGISASLLAVALLAAAWTDGAEFFVARAPAAAVVTLQLFLVALGGPALCLAALVQERERDADALRESEARYRTVVETQTELITRYRPDLTLTFVNDATCRYIGKSREEMLGARIDADLDSANSARVQEMVQALLAQPDPGVLTIEHEAPFHDGSVHWQQWVNRTILDADGQVVELQGIGRDITARKRGEEALRASEERFRTAFESAAVGMMLVDLGGGILQVNRQLVEMLGYTEDELLTHTFMDFTDPEDLEPNLALFARAVAGEIDRYQFEKRYVHRNGQIIWVRVSAGVVCDAGGRPHSLIGQLEDNSERKRLEQEREEARAQAERRAEELDRVFGAMADGVAIYDQDGREVRTNMALQRLLGFAMAPLHYAQMPIQERMALFAARDERGRPLDPDEGPLPRALRGEVVSGAETQDIRSRTLDGREIELSVSAAPLHDQEGRVTGAVAVFHDQTDRRRLEREVGEQAQQLQTILDSLSDPLFVYDGDGRLLRSNPAARQLLYPEIPDATLAPTERASRYEVRDDLGRPLPREQWPLTRLLRGEVLAGAGAQDVFLRLPDGRDALLSYTGGPIYDAEGKITAVVAIARDLTERHNMERAHAEQAEQLNRIFEGIEEGLVVYDAQGHIVRSNPAARRILGLEAAPSTYDGLDARERAILYEARDESGQPLGPEEWPLVRVLQEQGSSGPIGRDLQLRMLDGRELDIYSSAAPLRDASGHFLGAVTILLDQSARKRLEREREEARERAQARSAELEAVLGAMTDGVVVYDSTGKITYRNAALRTMFAAEARADFARLSLAERAALAHARSSEGQALPVDQLPQARVLRGETLHSGEAVDLVEDALDGRALTLQVAGSPLRDAAGEITGAVLVYRDMTEERRLARATRELAAQLRATLDAMSDAVFLYDMDGRVRRLNAAAREFIGEPASTPEFYEQPFPERALTYRMRWPDGSPVTAENWSLASVLRGEALTTEQSQDLLLTDAQGRERVMNYVGAPVLDASGQSVGYVFVGRDVTANRRAEEAVRASEARFRAMFESAAIGAAVVDFTGRPLEVNAYVSQMLGYSADELCTLSLDDFTHPDDVAGNKALMRWALDGDLDSYQLEKRYLHKNGHFVWARVNAALVRPDDGRPAYFVVHFEDITERKGLERERDEQAAQLNRIFEGIADGLVVYNTEGQVVRTNPAARRLLGFDVAPGGYSKSSVADRARLFEARDERGRPLPPEAAPLPRVLSGEVKYGSVGCEMRLRSLDGREAEVYSSAAPLRDAKGHLLGAVIILHDQTERKRAAREQEEARVRELALHELNERLDTFVAIAAHELRRPVGVSKMVIADSQRRLLRAAAGLRNASGQQIVSLVQVETALDTARQSIETLWRLMQQLLDVTRTRQGTLVLDRQRWDLSALVREAVEEQRLLNPDRVLTLDLPAADAPPFIAFADADRIGHVIANYLANAVRYSPEDQPIEVSLKLARIVQDGADNEDLGRQTGMGDQIGRMALVEVRDHGPGVAPEEQERIWNRFQRARNVSETNGGLGLGLYIARTIIALHDGQVGVDSQLGDGATFWFTLPMAPVAWDGEAAGEGSEVVEGDQIS